jgi:hypothetical protein
MDAEQLDCFVQAMERKCIFRDIDGELYAFRLDPTVGWWCWKLRYGSNEYFIDPWRKTCTCPSGVQPCKHYVALMHRAPSARTRPLQRGER